MSKKWLLPLAVLLLTPWPVAYAYDNAGAAVDAVRVEAAPAQSQPGWKLYGGAIGGVTDPGDLFYVDTESPADFVATLYMTNTGDLIHYYRYLTLKVGVYVQTDTGWQKVTGSNGSLPDTYITMQNGRVAFTLPGYARYKFTIDGGSYYAYKAPANSDDAAPAFYLATE